MSRVATVVICDDHALFREGIKAVLMRKLDIHDRAELIKFAIRENLIRLPVMSTPTLDLDSE